MNYDDIDALRRHSAAWRVLRADSAVLIITFINSVFIEGGVRSISASALTIRLEDTLYDLNSKLGEGTFPRSAKDYLTTWSDPGNGWLRKYYPPGEDEPYFDATADMDKAILWLNSLGARTFIGTESRLNTVFDLLQQLVYGAETDPEARLLVLRERRAEIDAEIASVIKGDLSVMDAAGRKDRYQQLSATAKELLSDFREVESNFRALDRKLRETIATWDGTKGELLDSVVGSRNSISESEQGVTFHAFYDFLLSTDRQEEFVALLERVHGLEGIGEVDARMPHIHHDWLEAGERTQSTVRLLSEQLRRFLDDKVWLENRRVIELLRSIETNALELRNLPVKDLTMTLEGLVSEVNLPLERPLYTPSTKVSVESEAVTLADEELETELLFSQVRIDRDILRRHVKELLTQNTQVGLRDLLANYPLEHGLAELVTYLSLDDTTFEVLFDETKRITIECMDDEGNIRTVTLAETSFVKGRTT